MLQMNSINLLQKAIDASNKASVANTLGITISHLNNLLAGRKTISKYLELKLSNINNDFIVFEVDKNSNIFTVIEVLSEYIEQIENSNIEELKRKLCSLFTS